MMMDRSAPITAFRTRLSGLLDEKFDGQYTVLAKRAGIPTSTMQHYIHTAKHLPGGEHLMRIAQACGTTVDYLVSGMATVRPEDLLTHPVSIVKAKGDQPAAADRQLSVPAFACTCPKRCVLTDDVPSPRHANGRIVIPEELVRSQHYHRLISVILTKDLLPRSPDGRAIIDWDARTVEEAPAPFLFFDGTRHRIGPLRNDKDTLLLVEPATVLPDTAQVLGRMVAVLTKT